MSFQKGIVLFVLLTTIHFMPHSSAEAQKWNTVSSFGADSVLWMNYYGGEKRDVGGSISIGSNGDLLIVGSTQSFGAGRDDLWLIKMNVEGDTLWTKTLGTSNTERTGTNSVISTSKGGWVVGGSKFINPENNYDILLIEIDPEGRELWRKTIGGEGRDQLESIQKTKDGRFILSAAKTENGWETPWILLTTSNGDTLWTRSFPGTGNGSIEAAIESHDGSFILAGSENDNWNESTEYPIDLVIRKLASDGSTIWTWKYGGDITHVWPEWVEETKDGDIVIVGAICEPCSPLQRNYQTNFDAFIVKLSSEGDALWTRRLGGNENDLAYFMQISERNTYIIGGSTSSHDGPDDAPWIFELNQNGEIIWSRILPSSFPRNGVAQIGELNENEYLITGPPWLYQREGNQDLWILKLKRNK